MILDLITKELRIVLGEGKTTSDCEIVTSWAEMSTGVWLGGNTNIHSNGTTPVVVVASPSNNTVVREVREVRLYNADTVTHTVTLQLYDGTTAWHVAPAVVSVLAGGSFIYTPEAGITVVNPSSATSGITVVDGDGTTITGVTNLTFEGPIVTGSSPNATATLVPWGQLSGCSITVASTTSFTVSSGQAASSDNTTLMTLASGLTKLTGGTWVAGNNQNGLDTGTINAATWYHVYVIFNPTTLVVDVLFSTNATTPSLPSGFTKFRRVGSLRTGGTTALFTIIQNGDRFDYNGPVNFLNNVTPGVTTAQTVTPLCPLGVITEVIIESVIADATTSDAAIWISSLAQTDLAVASASGTISMATSLAAATTDTALDGLRIVTNLLSQIRYRLSQTTTTVYMSATGYIDRRGRG